MNPHPEVLTMVWGQRRSLPWQQIALPDRRLSLPEWPGNGKIGVSRPLGGHGRDQFRDLIR
jgi:hypothetical protein